MAAWLGANTQTCCKHEPQLNILAKAQGKLWMTRMGLPEIKGLGSTVADLADDLFA